MDNKKNDPPPKPSPSSRGGFFIRLFERYIELDKRHKKTTRIVSIALMIALVSVLVFLSFRVPTNAEDLSGRWWVLPLVFFSSFAGSASIFFPAPATIATCVALASGTLLSPNTFLVIGVGSIGSALGELSSYTIGYLGSGFVDNNRYYKRIKNLVNRYGGPTIFVLSFVSFLPLFDLAGIAAGSAQMRVNKFLIWTVLGKIVKLSLVALLCISLYGWASEPSQSWIWRIFGLNAP